MPLLAAILGVAIVVGAGLQGLQAFLLQLAIQAVGYIGGTYYSLGYLRRSAITDNWRGFIAPSVITFIVLSIMGFAANSASFMGSTMAIGILLTYYGAIVLAFIKITADGFRDLQNQSEAGRSLS